MEDYVLLSDKERDCEGRGLDSGGSELTPVPVPCKYGNEPCAHHKTRNYVAC